MITILQQFYSTDHHRVNTYSFRSGIEGWYHHNHHNTTTPTHSSLPPPLLSSPPPPPLPRFPTAGNHWVNTYSFQSVVEGWYHHNTTTVLLSRPPSSQHLLFPVWGRGLVPSQYYNSSTEQTTITSTPTLSSLGSRAGTITILQQFYSADHHHVNTYSFQSGVEGWGQPSRSVATASSSAEALWRLGRVPPCCSALSAPWSWGISVDIHLLVTIVCHQHYVCVSVTQCLLMGLNTV